MVGDRCAIRGVTVLPSPLLTRRQTGFVQERRAFQRRFEALQPLAVGLLRSRSAGQTLKRTLVPRWQELGCRLRELRGGDGAVMRTACFAPSPTMRHPAGCRSSTLCSSLRIYTLQRRKAIRGSGGVPLILVSPRWARARHTQYSAPARAVSSPSHSLPGLPKPCRRRATRARGWRGFDPARFFRNLPLVDGDPSAGWFWPVVTSFARARNHWRAAHLRLVGSGSTQPASSSMTRIRRGNRTAAGLRIPCNELMHAAWTPGNPRKSFVPPCAAPQSGVRGTGSGRSMGLGAAFLALHRGKPPE